MVTETKSPTKKSTITIFHNPRCSKSRQTLALIEQHGGSYTVEVIEYLKVGITPKQITSILSELNISARELMRTKEAEYKEQNLADAELSEQQLIDAISATPKLLERPIVQLNGQTVIGRPPENVLTIL